MCNINIDGKELQVPAGITILDAAHRAGAHIPTLCYLEGYKPQGACRVCVVEVEGAKALVASCATPVREGMVVWTSSRRVRKARKAVTQLLLSEHDANCQYCDRSEDCELKDLAYQLDIRDLPLDGEKPPAKIDATTPALFRDPTKCIKCRRCVTACNDVQAVGTLFPQYRGYQTQIAPAFAHDVASVACVQCGQCAAVCPTGAISEANHIERVLDALDDPTQTVVVQTAPAIRAALGECFGLPPGTRVTGRMVAALRRLGFDAVFDTNFAADLTIMEEGTELLTRLKAALAPDAGNGPDAHTHGAGPSGPSTLPQFTSCSPGWINYAEHFYPEFLDNISSCKSPQQMFGALAKSYYAETLGIAPEHITVVSAMPCTAKKYEAQRPEMRSGGEQDVDYVLTTRELGRLIKMMGIDLPNLEDEQMDAPLGLSSGAADIFANTGGVMEAAVRTAYELVTGRALPLPNLHVESIAGLEGVKEATLTFQDVKEEWQFLEGVELRVAVAHGLANAAAIMERIRAGVQYHFVEIMTCPGGCIGGGGQPRFTDDAVRQARIGAIYEEDEGKEIRTSHANPAIQALYKQWLGAPLGEKSHRLLHTSYVDRGQHVEQIEGI